MPNGLAHVAQILYKHIERTTYEHLEIDSNFNLTRSLGNICCVFFVVCTRVQENFKKDPHTS